MAFDSRSSQPLLSISVVSHRQMELVLDLLQDLVVHCQNFNFELILTINIDEVLSFSISDMPFDILVIRNVTPKGFGFNHNQAHAHSKGVYFCVINPDIRLSNDPFFSLLNYLKYSDFGVVGPLVLGPDGRVEDSARRFPSPFKILKKALCWRMNPDYVVGHDLIYPDWIGGMFMVFKSSVFQEIGGFDRRYFLYYEDVDICGRLNILGYKSVVCPQVNVVHHAQRSSHRSLKYLRWHLTSMLRFFLSSVYWRLQWRKFFSHT